MITKILDIDEQGNRAVGAWGIVSNFAARDKGLSFEALGLLTMLLLRNPKGDCSIADMIRESNKQDAILAIMQELIAKKYVKRTLNRVKGKFTAYNYEVYEVPYIIAGVAVTPIQIQTYEPVAPVPIVPEPMPDKILHEVAAETLIAHFEKHPEQKLHAKKVIGFDLPVAYFVEIVKKYMEFNKDNRLIMSNPIKNWDSYWASFGQREVRIIQRKIAAERRMEVPATQKNGVRKEEDYMNRYADKNKKEAKNTYST